MYSPYEDYLPTNNNFNEIDLVEKIKSEFEKRPKFTKRLINSNSKPNEVTTLIESHLDLVDIDDIKNGLPSIPIITIFEASSSIINTKYSSYEKFTPDLRIQICVPNLDRKKAYLDSKVLAKDIIDFFHEYPDLGLNQIKICKVRRVERIGTRKFKEAFFQCGLMLYLEVEYT